MFEINMDEYLDEEVDSAKVTFESICKKWEIQVWNRCLPYSL